MWCSCQTGQSQTSAAIPTACTQPHRLCVCPKVSGGCTASAPMPHSYQGRLDPFVSTAHNSCKQCRPHQCDPKQLQCPHHSSRSTAAQPPQMVPNCALTTSARNYSCLYAPPALSCHEAQSMLRRCTPAGMSAWTWLEGTTCLVAVHASALQHRASTE